jgi:AAA15 family ATPase/GTPase
MKLLENLEIRRYRNIHHAELESLDQLNILIGPNNAGKSNILNVIKKLGGQYTNQSPQCDTCNSIQSTYSTVIQGDRESIDEEELYLREKDIGKIVFEFSSEITNRLSETELPSGIDQRSKNHISGDLKLSYVSDSRRNRLINKHLNLLNLESNRDFYENLNILHIPPDRLEDYKGQDFSEYMNGKRLRGSQMRELISEISEIVDPSIVDHNMDRGLVIESGGEESKSLDETIQDQGSGVRAIIGVLIDIIDKDPDLLLLDEPENGLNPRARRRFLNMLVDKDIQIFLTTHDPAFVNPVLWNKDNVSIFNYSPYQESFVKIDKDEAKEDASIFAGFLPHVMSSKPFHLYVEGSLDVYNFRILLRKYLKQKYPDSWFQKLNNVGIYHLGGSNWPNLVSTIPADYHNMVVLDGDKSSEVRELISKFNQARKTNFYLTPVDDKGVIGEANASDSRSEVVEKEDSCPVYCLNRDEIEDYIGVSQENKKEGPKEAEKIEESDIPEEIEKIFDDLISEPEEIDSDLLEMKPIDF